MTRPTRFAADAMLGSLARKLRIFGFDTLYYREGPDSELVSLAESEGRVVLTSDRALAAYSAKHGVVAFLIEGSAERERLVSLEEEARRGSFPLEPGDTRCASCNIPLARLRRRDVVQEVPRGVVARRRTYFRCSGCGKLYWKGSHWRRLKRLSALLPRQ